MEVRILAILSCIVILKFNTIFGYQFTRIDPLDWSENIPQTPITNVVNVSKRVKKQKPPNEMKVGRNVTITDYAAMSEKSSTAVSTISMENLERKLLKTVPKRVVDGFDQWLNDIVLRVATMMITIHALLLTATAKYIVQYLHAPIYPYILIAPFLFPISPIYRWLWQNSIIESNLINKALRNSIRDIKKYAIEKLQSFHDDLTDFDTNSTDFVVDENGNVANKQVEQYILAKLMSETDPEALYQDVKYFYKERAVKDAVVINQPEILYNSIGLADTLANANDSSIQQLFEMQRNISDDQQQFVANRAISIIGAIFNTTNKVFDKIDDSRKNRIANNPNISK